MKPTQTFPMKVLKKLPKGLFLIALLFMIWMALFAGIVRWNALPNMAELMPAETTEAFWIADREILLAYEEGLPAQMLQFMGTSIHELTWMDEKGGAWVDGQNVEFISVNDSSEAKNFLEGLLLEGETWEKEKANLAVWSTVSCYTQGQAYCFTWVGNLLFVSAEKAPLLRIQETVYGNIASIESTPNYQNLRGRLAQWNGAFYYIDIQKVKNRFMDDFGAVSSLLELFPVTGGVFKMEEGQLLSEHFLAVDKLKLGGEAFYSSSEKYEHLLLPWTSETLAWEWSGQGASTQWLRIEEILKSQSPASALLWRSTVEQKLKSWFGEDFSLEQDLIPLLQDEQYFAFTPGEDFLFLSELENEEEMRLADELRERWMAQGALWDPVMELEIEKYKGVEIYHFSQRGEDLASTALLSGLVMVTHSRERLLSTLDKALGQTEPRNLNEWKGILSGSDELLILHCPLLPEETILKTLCEGWEDLSSSRKLFDDGVFTRSTLRL